MYNISVSIPVDEDGYTGRECPECETYFKVIFGTGLKGISDCICPYCGHKDDHKKFYTPDQIEYIRSVVQRRFFSEAQSMFRDAFKSSKNIKFKVKDNRLPALHAYHEAKLETRVTCKNCTLKYAVYGVYAYCSDCGSHNSQQILESNFELAQKELDLAETVNSDLAEYLRNDALENVVSAFDGFGREICRLHASKSTNPSQAADIRFQNLKGSQTNLQKHFGLDISSSVTVSEWDHIIRCFNKRHLLAHNSGVIDDDYLAKANDSSAIKGRKIIVIYSEVVTLIEIIRKIGAYMSTELGKLP